MDRGARIVSERRVFDEFLKVDEIIFRQSGVDDWPPNEEKHFIVERGDSVAGLVHDVERDMVILTRQFRIAVFRRRARERHDGAFVELPTGSIDDGETPEISIRREVLEEIGYEAQDVKPIMTVFVSPGGTTERVHLFYVPVAAASLVDASAGGIGNEQIERVEMPTAQFAEACSSGDLEDAKTVVAGLWLKSRGL